MTWILPHFGAGSTPVPPIFPPLPLCPPELNWERVTGRGPGPLWPHGWDWEGKLGPVQPPGPVKMAAPMGNMAAPIGRRGLEPHPRRRIGWWEPGIAEVFRKEPSARRGRKNRGDAKRLPETAEVFQKEPRDQNRCFSERLAPSFSGRTRSVPESAEAGRGPVDFFRKKPKRPRACPNLSRKSRGAPGPPLPETPEPPPARPFRSPPSPLRPRAAPSGEPRSRSGTAGSGSKAAPPAPSPARKAPKRSRSGSGSCQATPEFAERFRSRSQSGSREPRGGPGNRPAVPKRVRRVPNRLPLSGDPRKVPSGSGRPSDRSAKPRDGSEAVPEIPEAVPEVAKRLRRFPKRFRKLPKRFRRSSGSSRTISGAARSDPGSCRGVVKRFRRVPSGSGSCRAAPEVAEPAGPQRSPPAPGAPRAPDPEPPPARPRSLGPGGGPDPPRPRPRRPGPAG